MFSTLRTEHEPKGERPRSRTPKRNTTGQARVMDDNKIPAPILDGRRQSVNWRKAKWLRSTWCHQLEEIRTSLKVPTSREGISQIEMLLSITKQLAKIRVVTTERRGIIEFENTLGVSPSVLLKQKRR